MPQKVPVSKNEMIKASGAIHIRHSVTLMQQKLWNILLANAFPDLGDVQKFSISIEKLLAFIPYKTRNIEYLKGCLVALRETTVEYNILGKDKNNHWGAFGLLANPQIKNGTCTYSYDFDLQELLKDPAIYARINLQVQSRFKSKYSLFLYELFVDYKGVGKTPKFDLPFLQQEYLGIGKNEYPQFKHFNDKVLKVALKEINRESDLDVEASFFKTGRRVTAIQFLIAEKTKKPDWMLQDELFLLPPEEQLEKKKITPRKKRKLPPQKQIQENSLLFHTMIGRNISQKIVTEALEAHTESEITEALAVIDQQEENIKNIDAFFLKALKQGWTPKRQYNPKQDEQERETIQRRQDAERTFRERTPEQNWRAYHDICLDSASKSSLIPAWPDHLQEDFSHQAIQIMKHPDVKALLDAKPLINKLIEEFCEKVFLET